MQSSALANSFIRSLAWLTVALALAALGCNRDDTVVLSEGGAVDDSAAPGDVEVGPQDGLGDGANLDDQAGNPADAGPDVGPDVGPDADPDGGPETTAQDASGQPCSTPSDCGGATPYCELTSQKCVACIVASQCADAGSRCTANSCVSAVACTNDKTCVAFDAVCDKAKGFCVSCLATSDCLAPQTCQANTCLDPPKSCGSSKDCATLGQVCSAKAKQCVDCADDGDCADSAWCLQNFCVADVCPAGSTSCAGATALKTCAANGSQWSETPCPGGEVCEQGSCAPVVCKAGELRCAGQQAEKCSSSGTGWQKAEDCAASGLACKDGSCVAPTCIAGAKQCAAGGVVTCEADMLGWSAPSACPAEASCVNGSCQPWTCIPNSLTCIGQFAVSCSGDGLTPNSVDCAKEGKICSEGSCWTQVCQPSQLACDGAATKTCDSKGLSWGPLTACPSTSSCSAGKCEPWVCTPDAKFCEGGAVKLCAANGLSSSTAESCSASGKVCAGGQCLAQLCIPGTKTCNGKELFTCNGDGLGWSAPSTCPVSTSCDKGSCAPWVCTPNSLLCQGKIAKACAADGLSEQSADCAATNQLCSQGKCVTPLCVPGTGQCQGNSSQTCSADGLSWSALAACPASTTCAAGVCKGQVCTPNTVGCSGSSATLCAADGLSSASTDCAKAGKICVGGSCVAALCTPGATLCSGNGVVTCNANGSGWSNPAACGVSHSCVQGKCAPWICEPKAVVCEGSNLAICDATGLSKQLTDCKASGKVCSAGACQNQLCPANSSQCAPGNAVSVCAADGMSWGGSQACSSSTTCSKGACVPWVCKPGELVCEGNTASQCAADGLSKLGVDCGKDGKVCELGQCKAVICKPGTAKCEGNASSQCQSPGTSWAVVSCDDKDACTQDICNVGSGYCAHQFVKCDDGKVCTADSCDTVKGCLHAALTGGCDDGTACTTGEICASNGDCKPPGVAEVSVLAGDPANKLSLDGKGKLAGFAVARAVCSWASGSWLVLDGKLLRVVAKDGAVTTLAGNGVASVVDGKGSGAGIASAEVVAADGQGNAFFADSASILRKVSADGTVTTLGGTLGTGYTDGPVAKARFGTINGLAVDGSGGLWIADSKNNRLRRMTPGGVVETMAGTGEAAYVDGPAAQAKIATPIGLAVAGDGSVYFGTGTRLRALSKGTVTTVAGSGAVGTQDGAASSAQFMSIYGISLHPNGQIWLTDTSAHRLRSIDLAAGWVATVAGSSSGFADGKGTLAKLTYPTGLGIDLEGRAAVVDQQWRLVRSIQGDTAICNDGNPCTADSCDPVSGTCKASALSAGANCSDGNACTAGEACDSGGACKGGKAKLCDDSNPCTDDLCDAWTGACAPTNHVAPCAGSDKCVLHACVQGKCTASQAEFATLAGTGVSASTDGKGPLAAFHNASGLGLGPDGALWVAERGMHQIRRIAPDGSATTVAGLAGVAGSADGPVSTASFYGPGSVAVDKGGLVYVADTQNHRIRRITPAGMVSTLAGSTAGYADGAGSSAKFYSPEGIALDVNGNLYVADLSNQRIRKVTPGGQVSTVAGSGVYGYLDGAVTSAKFYSPLGLTVDVDGSLLVADTYNQRIRRIDLGKGEVSTLAGGGSAGSQDGAASSATFYYPGSIAVTASGIAVFDTGTKRLRRIAAGSVTTLAGLGAAVDDGPIGTAALGSVTGMAVDAKGRLALTQVTRIRYITDTAVRCDDGSPCTTEACDPANGTCKVSQAATGSSCSDGNSCTSGDACSTSGVCAGTAKKCDDANACTEDLCVAGSGACEHPVWAATCSDGDACTPADLCLAGQCRSDLPLLSTIAGQAGAGFVNGAGVKAAFGTLFAAAWLADGSAAALDGDNHAVRLVKADGTVSNLCGGNGPGYVDGGCSQAKFSSPRGMVGDAKGNLYVADTGNHRIRVISAAGMVSTLAGSGTLGFQDGPGSSAAFYSPAGLALAADGSLVVGDMGNYRLRKVAVDGAVSTLAGSGAQGKQDGAASSATFSGSFYGLAYDALGRLWIADGGNTAVRRLDGGKTVVTVAAGSGGAVDGPAASAKFGAVFQLAISPSGTVYIADTSAYRIRSLSPSGQVGTWMGSSAGFSDGAPAEAKLAGPRAIALGPKGKLLIGDGYRLRIATPAAVDCDDGLPCTLDTCSKGTGECSHQALGDGSACSDGNVCTAGETCSKGSCGGGQAQNCDDNNPCTDDSCDAGKGCVHAAVANGQSCGTDKVCLSGTCAVASCLNPLPQQGKYVGAPVTMETYSHGGGYSPTYQEYWYPAWAGTVVNRFDKNRKYLGSFASGTGEIMQLAGDVDDTYYTANWSYNSVSKWSGMGSKLLWTYKLSSSASCVAVDSQYVYVMGSNGSSVYVLSKDQGKLVTGIALLSAPSTTPYGSLAVVGDSIFVGQDTGTVRRFDKGTGQMLDTFQAPVKIYNMAFDGKNYCVSANTNQVYCYTIAVAPPGCP